MLCCTCRCVELMFNWSGSLILLSPGWIRRFLRECTWEDNARVEGHHCFCGVAMPACWFGGTCDFFIDLCRRWKYIHILTADKLYIVPKAIEIDSQPDVLRVGMWHACHMRWRWILWRSLLSVRSLIRWRSSLNICSLTFARPGLKFRWCHWDLGVDNCAATRLSEETFRWTEFPASGGAWSGQSRCGWYQRGICIVSQPLHWQLLGGAGVKPCGIGRRVGAIPGWSCQ